MRHERGVLGRAGRSLAVCALAATIGLIAGWHLRAADADEDATTLATTQIDRFFAGTSGKAELSEMLGDAFQLMRTDGTRFDRAGYLARPASIQSYSIDRVQAVLSGDVLTATFYAAVKGQIGDLQRHAEGQPRLAVFTRQDGDWKVQAYANLGAGNIADPDEEGRKAVDAWLAAVTGGDATAIAGILAPEFQIVRADGAAYGKDDYLAQGLPKITAPPQVEGLTVTTHGEYLVARYSLLLSQEIDGVVKVGHAPRLTVFRRSGTDWLVVAHSNFARID